MCLAASLGNGRRAPCPCPGDPGQELEADPAQRLCVLRSMWMGTVVQRSQGHWAWFRASRVYLCWTELCCFLSEWNHPFISSYMRLNGSLFFFSSLPLIQMVLKQGSTPCCSFCSFCFFNCFSLTAGYVSLYFTGTWIPDDLTECYACGLS